jgi:hypothetical protein
MVGRRLRGFAGGHPGAPNVARADTAGDNLVKVLADHGIPGDPSQFVAEGHRADFFINAAESPYCPQFVGLEHRSG